MLRGESADDFVFTGDEFDSAGWNLRSQRIVAGTSPALITSLSASAVCRFLRSSFARRLLMTQLATAFGFFACFAMLSK